MKVIVFDLDDTLYDEITYVHSGFRAVAMFLLQEFCINPDESMRIMLSELETSGRGKVFDRLLAHNGIYSKANVGGCLRVYRRHDPQIQLYEDAIKCIEQLQEMGTSLYIVTDGNKWVQYRKLKALGLYDHPGIQKCYISRRFGTKNEKPSPYCFMQICAKERVEPTSVVYIGDNPNKDFVGIKPLGFKTVRLLRGGFADIQKPINYEADIKIDTLDELVEKVIIGAD
ncbi:HAD family hydrolase [Paenibacillus segetis]|uniref:HAD superfamily hydrolase n=1 Tax=Paenibacillus segetis TaxID=1325360 RepID=A0ABQ1YQC7_9BACL|nr:HAD-IA family hydrolase [Paenibacillus segetis]GGH33098.1 HAD superfamily hydrolase [Paenibacillus segetis]